VVRPTWRLTSPRAISRLTDEDLARLHAMQDAIVAAVERGDAAAERMEWDLHALINRLARWYRPGGRVGERQPAYQLFLLVDGALTGAARR
jgi:hypothetical protein